MSKIDGEIMRSAVASILDYKKKHPRKFVETIELQVGLKNYDPNTDRRFSGSIALPVMACPRRTVCVFADAAHEEEAQKKGLPFMNVGDLKKLNKDKKLVRKLGHKYDYFLASDSLIKQLPRLLGPTLNKMGKFPTVVTHTEDLAVKAAEVKSSVKFQLKKALCLNVPVARVDMNEQDIIRNISISINFLCSLLKKNWQNIRRIHIKSTMSPPQLIY
ncbi:putative 60S ribosomal protein L10a-1 [Monocercomonoides exilis]|uniref:putative large subunit ribosomal protein 1 n=1 Tax=Monocercomonoides exilis TaxID=2049356 RepID=UPI0035597026|nr:putative large subunit ribosomal protein 1 [Monocercomonoides exilis]KAH7831253.1 putative 60S ribosomal protein L10a-1 [Monocercomonoides exilis]|eukprot:MONOS_771.1-p1 / transcript=MONOS_771.1 / gene=MONOS_771 / organism=Monocercomonoides_exilis_PA203 / gene_product=large subunit ribosomal protein 1 / transcript_product=large subunit ribosomal protein 1 / location=Mono_scaffold00013:57676-58391(+) / protein_length=216 / sequence_SO=supercontig / SO=protein_coding / is_pseudo=false